MSAETMRLSEAGIVNTLKVVGIAVLAFAGFRWAREKRAQKKSK